MYTIGLKTWTPPPTIAGFNMKLAPKPNSMNNYLVIACSPCKPSNADVMLDNQPFVFGTCEKAKTYQDAVTIHRDMTEWCNALDQVVIFNRTEVEALVNNGGVQ